MSAQKPKKGWLQEVVKDAQQSHAENLKRWNLPPPDSDVRERVREVARKAYSENSGNYAGAADAFDDVADALLADPVLGPRLRGGGG